jgi:hypothetical protein
VDVMFIQVAYFAVCKYFQLMQCRGHTALAGSLHHVLLLGTKRPGRCRSGATHPAWHSWILHNTTRLSLVHSTANLVPLTPRSNTSKQQR